MEGTIKKVVRDRGFGFIKAQDGKEVFSTAAAFKDSTLTGVREGQHVEFEVERGEKSPRAVRIRASVA
jgi:cold shock protein